MTRKVVSTLKVLLTANWRQDRKNSFWEQSFETGNLDSDKEENQDQNKKLDSDEEENGAKFIFRLDMEENR